MSFQREHVQNVTLTPPGFASQELQAKEGQDTNREAVNALPHGAIVAAEAAAAKVESASNETFMISGQQRAVRTRTLIPLFFLPVSYCSICSSPRVACALLWTSCFLVCRFPLAY